MVTVQHHHVSPQRLHQDANHAAWLEDNRRNSNGENATDIFGKAMVHGVSRVWKGYWQRLHCRKASTLSRYQKWYILYMLSRVL